MENYSSMMKTCVGVQSFYTSPALCMYFFGGEGGYNFLFATAVNISHMFAFDTATATISLNLSFSYFRKVCA